LGHLKTIIKADQPLNRRFMSTLPYKLSRNIIFILIGIGKKLCSLKLKILKLGQKKNLDIKVIRKVIPSLGSTLDKILYKLDGRR